jgi:predicted ATP-grasp superfamily ATP-dependent carboligase
LDLAKREQLRGWFLIGSNDHIVENLTLHQNELAQYYKMMVPSKEQLFDIINKARLLDRASSCGTSIPTTCYLETQEKARLMRYPLLIKGCHGLSFFKATHRKAIQVNSYDELCAALKDIRVLTDDVMIQELIPFDAHNRVVSFTCFAINGEIKAYWMGQKLREHPIRYGTATMSQSVLIPQVIDEAKPLVKALQYTGTCEIEFMRDSKDGKWKLIEMNPRTWLWVGLAKECGVDYAKMMYRFVNNIEQQYPDSYKVGVKWYNAVTDFVFGMQAIFKGVVSAKEYLQSICGHKVHAIWSWHDLKPGIIFPFILFHINKKRK